METGARAGALAIVLLVAGCLGNAGPAPETSGPATPTGPSGPGGNASQPLADGSPMLVLKDCAAFQGVKCFEPWIWADALGRAFVVTGKGDVAVRSFDQGTTWGSMPTPPRPDRAPSGGQGGDTVIQSDAQGRLYWHALFYDPTRVQGQFGSGLVVARSDDGGQTWPARQYLDHETHPQTGTGFTDRQWMATGTGDRVFLAFWEVGVGTWLSTSQDAGKTFGPFLRMVTVPERQHILPHGQIQVTPAGTLLSPYHALINPSQGGFLLRGMEVRVARSTDGGLVYTQIVVASGAAYGASGYWPDLVQAENGRLVLAWTSDSGAVWVSQSTNDGTTWSTPVRWTPTDTAATLTPKLVAGNGTIAVAWYSSRDGGQARGYSVSIGPYDAKGPGDVRTLELARINFTNRMTDHGALARFPDGTLGAAWIDPATGIWYQRIGV